MSRDSAVMAPIPATEVWFVRHGLPYFVPSERAAAREALQPRKILPLVLVVGLAAAAVAVALAWVSSDFSFAPAMLTLIGVVAAAFYAITALRARPILTWAAAHTFNSLRQLLPMVTRALPLLLIFVTFLFISTEVWQVASHLDGGVLWLTVLMFAALAVVFLLVRLPEELDRADYEVDEARLRAACRRTPLADEVDRLVGEEGELRLVDSHVSGYERSNLVLVLLVAQGVQVVLLAAAVFVFFLVFGAIAMNDTVIQSWVGEPTHHLPGLANLSVELVQVAVFLAAFSGLYFTVVVVTDETYRDQFFTGVMGELDRAVCVRAAYLTLAESQSQSPSPAPDPDVSPPTVPMELPPGP